MNYLDFFSVDVWTTIFTLVNMVILLTLTKKILFKPVMKIIAQREAEVQKMYSDAETASRNAAVLEKEYNEKMARARDEAGEIIKQATVTAQKREADILAEAHEKAGIVLRRAEAEIEQERKKAYQDIKNDISDISVAIASKMVQKEISAENHAALIEQFIENVGESNE